MALAPNNRSESQNRIGEIGLVLLEGTRLLCDHRQQTIHLPVKKNDFVLLEGELHGICSFVADMVLNICPGTRVRPLVNWDSHSEHR